MIPFVSQIAARISRMVRGFVLALRLLRSGWRIRRWDGVGRLAWHAPGTPCVCHNVWWAWSAELVYRDTERSGGRRSDHHSQNSVLGQSRTGARRVGAKGKVSGKDVLAVWKMYGNRCWCCGQAATEIDHYRPINKKAGGTNTKDNLRPICRECNQKRSHFWHGDDVAVKEAGLLKRLKELLQGEASER